MISQRKKRSRSQLRISCKENVADTEDGGAEPYVHGKVSGDVAKIRVEQVLQLDAKDAREVSSESGYELLSENDLLEEIGKEEKE